MAKRIVITPVKTTVSEAVNDALGLIEEIAGEFREYVDSVSGTGLENTERAQQWEEAADTLEYISSPDIPECVEDVEVEYTPVRIPNYESGVGRRRLLREQALAMLDAAKSAAESFREELSNKADELTEAADAKAGEQKEGDSVEDTVDDLFRQSEELDTFCSDLENVIDDIESAEF